MLVLEDTEKAYEVPSEGLFRLLIKDSPFPTNLDFYPYDNHWDENSSPFDESWTKLRYFFVL